MLDWGYSSCGDCRDCSRVSNHTCPSRTRRSLGRSVAV